MTPSGNLSGSLLIIKGNQQDNLRIEKAFKRVQESNRTQRTHHGGESLDHLRKMGGFVGVPRPNSVLMDLNTQKIAGLKILSSSNLNQFNELNESD